MSTDDEVQVEAAPDITALVSEPTQVSLTPAAPAPEAPVAAPTLTQVGIAIEDYVPYSILVYGESGAGKTRLCYTAPGRKLLIDVEGGTRFLPGKKIRWNPLLGEPVPVAGDWETCVVAVTNWKVAEYLMQVLQSGVHPFDSAIVDSLTELQKRCQDALNKQQMDQQAWGILLSQLETYVRQLRDLCENPIKPLKCVALTALQMSDKGKIGPAVQGSLRGSLPQFFDMVGYLYIKTTPQTSERVLLVVNDGLRIAKDRTDIIASNFAGMVANPNLSSIAHYITSTLMG